MSITVHERPGVYSVCDTASAVSGTQTSRTIGIAARATSGTVNAPVELHSYQEGLTAFGADGNGVEMMALLELLFANGAEKVVAVKVANNGSDNDYESAFSAICGYADVGIVVCDSTSSSKQVLLRDSVADAATARHERIAVVGGDEQTCNQLITHAAGINHERVVLVAPGIYDAAGTEKGAEYAAAALAGAIAAQNDPAVPVNGTVLRGVTGVKKYFSDSEVDSLVRGGVTPLEAVNGAVSPIRGITTRTTTDGASDATWRELTTTRIADDVIETVRNALRSRFSGSKNNARTREAIRSQVIVELEEKCADEIIDGYGEVSVTPDSADATLCLVEFGFAVMHGISRIFLTAHITV